MEYYVEKRGWMKEVEKDQNSLRNYEKFVLDGRKNDAKKDEVCFLI